MTNATNDRPIAHLAIADTPTRTRIADALVRQGWCVVEQPTGFHLLHAIADVIEGQAEALPGLLVVDAIARGCSGLSIAAGLRELGVRIPLVLIARPGDPRPDSDDPALRVTSPSEAPSVVVPLAASLVEQRSRDDHTRIRTASRSERNR